MRIETEWRMMKKLGLFLIPLFLLCGCSVKDAAPTEPADIWEIYTDDDLVSFDYCLYRVDCGNKNGEADMGMFQSVTDKENGPDEVTGKTWGYTNSENIISKKDKFGEGIREYKWEIKEGIEYDSENTGFYYSFEVPKGEYEVTLGFYDPFSVRKVSALVEDEKLLSDMKILKYKDNEAVLYKEVTDGVLDVKVYNPSRGTDTMQDPMLSYIVVRAVPRYSRKMLLSYMESIKKAVESPEKYKEPGYNVFLESLANAENVLICTESDYDNGNQEYRKAYSQLKKAYEELEEIMVYSSFKPGLSWTDTKGKLIQAHGGQVQKLTYKDKETGEEVTTWWWVGEDKTNGSHGGICAYSSTDLYNWQFEGIVMRNVSNRAALDEDEYFKELYKGKTKEELDHIYECLSAETAIIERPKLIYNEKTNKYILWFHADGPTQTSNSSYAAASAGVAISDTPYGPFEFVERYRLNTCPEDQEDFHPESKGMARDMNLFTDDDGTAYIIYSSEENLTLYISKLNSEYTYLATPPEEAEYGKDFIRLFPGAQREAPALFKRDNKYYLVSSGCTGWAPNQARYYMADSVLGEWENMGDPCVGDTDKTTFSSQSTCVFKTDNDTFIFMADRWLSDDLPNSPYIWLPVKFEEDGRMTLEFVKEWKY